MPRKDVDKFIYEGSPFLPGISDEITQRVIANRTPLEPMEFTLAMELRAVKDYHVPELLSQIDELFRRFGTMPPDLKMFMLGFDAPLFMIAIGYLATYTSEADALSKIPPSNEPITAEFNKYIKQNIKFYQAALGREPSGRLIFLNEEENPFSLHNYYMVGVRSAKITYLKYAQFFGAEFD